MMKMKQYDGLSMCKLVQIYCYSVVYAAVNTFWRLLVGRTVKLTAFTFFFNVEIPAKIMTYTNTVIQKY